MNIKLTKEQQEVVDRIKVEGKFEELYYSGPLRRGRVVVRCEGMEGDYRFNDPSEIPSGVGIVNGYGLSSDQLDVYKGGRVRLNNTSVSLRDYALATSQIIEPCSGELDWSGVSKDGVDTARRILDNPKVGNDDVSELFVWLNAPYGHKWWDKQCDLYRAGTLTPELKAALESYIAYAEGVTPAVEAETFRNDAADALAYAFASLETQTITISLEDLRSIVQYGFEPSDTKLDAFIELVKGVAV